MVIDFFGKEHSYMATSSFTKSFVLDSKAAKKFEAAQDRPAKSIPREYKDRIGEGDAALKQYSSRLKK